MSSRIVREEGNILSWMPLALVAIMTGLVIGLTITGLPNSRLAIILVPAIIIAVAILVRPKLGILILAFISVSQFSDVLISFHNFPSIAQPFIALLLVAIGLNWLYTYHRPVGWPTVVVWVIFNGLLVLASLLYAENLTSAEHGLEVFVKDAVVAIIVAVLIQDMPTLRKTIWALLAAAIFLGTISTFQAITQSYDNNFWGFGQISTTDLETGDTAQRIGGPFDSSNFYAQILLLFVPLSLNRLMHENKPLLRFLAGWALIVCVLSIFWTFSRGGFIALILTFLYMFIRQPPRPATIGVALVLIALFMPLLPQSYIDRIATISTFNPLSGADVRNEQSLRGRTSEAVVGWLMFRDHPILGVGRGNYKIRYQDYSRQLGLDPRLENRSAHNLFLEIAAEQGVIGLAVFLSMLWAMFSMMRRSQQMLHDAGCEYDAEMIGSIEYGMFGYLCAAWFLHMAFPRPFWFMVGLTMASLHVAKNEVALQREKWNKVLHSYST